MTVAIPLGRVWRDLAVRKVARDPLDFVLLLVEMKKKSRLHRASVVPRQA
jgi:hypothetical protein